VLPVSKQSLDAVGCSSAPNLDHTVSGTVDKVVKAAETRIDTMILGVK
jgi:hypothetical protein